MFTSFESEVVSFDSSWKTDKIATEGGCQTSKFKTADIECSTALSKSISIQTESFNVNELTLPPTPPGLSAWIKKITPMVLKELLFVENTSIFEGYDPYEDDEEPEIRSKLLQRIHKPEYEDKLFSNKNDEDISLQSKGIRDVTYKCSVIDVCWSPSGNSLAVGYGQAFHEEWCQHDGYIHIFMKSSNENVLRHTVELRLPSCVSAVAYHSLESCILAAATVSGDVCVWNMQQQTQSAMYPSCEEHLPSKVSTLLWLTRDQSQLYLQNMDHANNHILVTGSVNGTVIMWLANKAITTIVKHKRYELYGSSLTRTRSIVDITCMDFLKSSISTQSFNSDEATLFVVGCRTGQIMVCQPSKANSITGSQNSDAYISSLEPHGGCVLQLLFSPSGNHLLSLGADLEIRVYIVPQEHPIQIVCLEYQLSSAMWMSGSDKLVIGAVGQALKEGQIILQVFDVSHRKVLLSVDGSHESNVENAQNWLPCPLTCIASNPKSPSIVACGDSYGVTYVWNLPLSCLSHS